MHTHRVGSYIWCFSEVVEHSWCRYHSTVISTGRPTAQAVVSSVDHPLITLLITLLCCQVQQTCPCELQIDSDLATKPVAAATHHSVRSIYSPPQISVVSIQPSPVPTDALHLLQKSRAINSSNRMQFPQKAGYNWSKLCTSHKFM